MSFAYIFPGQGSQEQGMLSDIINEYSLAKEIFQNASEITGYDFINICENNPENIITDAEISGLIIFCASAAIFNILDKNIVTPSFYAGYSIGQYSALYAAGILSFSDTLQILSERGKLLKKHGKKTSSTLAGIIGLTSEKVQEIISNFDNCYISNHNSPTNITIALKTTDKEKIFKTLIENKAMNVVEINVEGGWHSKFVENAAIEFKPFIEKYTYRKKNLTKIINNRTGKPFETIEQLKADLYHHVFQPVMWYQGVKTLIDENVSNFIEVGYGDQLSKFVKFTNRKVKVFQTYNLSKLNNLLNN